MPDRSRKTDRDCIELPIGDRRLNFPNHLFGSHSQTGVKFPFIIPRHHQLYVRAANIDDENSFCLLHDWPGGALIGVNLMERDFFESANRFA